MVLCYLDKHLQINYYKNINVMKLVKLILIIAVITSCNSTSEKSDKNEDREIDYQATSIKYVKRFLLDSNSFELINFELDTVRLSYSIREDYFRLSEMIDTNYFLDSELRTKKDSLFDMLILLGKLDSNPALDTAIGLQGNVRYYSINKSGQRVINTMGVVFLENSKDVTVLFNIDEDDVYDGE